MSHLSQIDNLQMLTEWRFVWFISQITQLYIYYTKYINTKNQRSFREGQNKRPLQSRLVPAILDYTIPYMYCSGKGQTIADASLGYHYFLMVTVIQGKDFPSISKNLSLK